MCKSGAYTASLTHQHCCHRCSADAWKVLRGTAGVLRASQAWRSWSSCWSLPGFCRCKRTSTAAWQSVSICSCSHLRRRIGLVLVGMFISITEIGLYGWLINFCKSFFTYFFFLLFFLSGNAVLQLHTDKGKSEHLYSALYGIQTTLKRSGMDHTVLPAINTIPAVYLVSVHQMAPPPIEVANI